MWKKKHQFQGHPGCPRGFFHWSTWFTWKWGKSCLFGGGEISDFGSHQIFMNPWMIPYKMYILSLYKMQIPGTIFKFLRGVMLLALAVVLRFGQTVSARVGGGFVYQTQVACPTKRGMGLRSEPGWCWWCWCCCWWWWVFTVWQGEAWANSILVMKV